MRDNGLNGQTYPPVQPNWLPGVCKVPSFLECHRDIMRDQILSLCFASAFSEQPHLPHARCHA